MKTMTPKMWIPVYHDTHDQRIHDWVQRNLATDSLNREVQELAPGNPPKYRDVLKACGWAAFAFSFGFACMVCVGLS